MTDREERIWDAAFGTAFAIRVQSYANSCFGCDKQLCANLASAIADDAVAEFRRLQPQGEPR